MLAIYWLFNLSVSRYFYVLDVILVLFVVQVLFYLVTWCLDLVLILLDSVVLEVFFVEYFIWTLLPTLILLGS